ncbi:hypothetical protein EKH55_5322 [Sinorhizobium alkalisoli]|nr:hypothetical protein EKH55_5322 [Sinorhizobium alkalisoli]
MKSNVFGSHGSLLLRLQVSIDAGACSAGRSSWHTGHAAPMR